MNRFSSGTHGDHCELIRFAITAVLMNGIQHQEIILHCSSLFSVVYNQTRIFKFMLILRDNVRL